MARSSKRASINQVLIDLPDEDNPSTHKHSSQRKDEAKQLKVAQSKDKGLGTRANLTADELAEILFARRRRQNELETEEKVQATYRTSTPVGDGQAQGLSGNKTIKYQPPTVAECDDTEGEVETSLPVVRKAVDKGLAASPPVERKSLQKMHDGSGKGQVQHPDLREAIMMSSKQPPSPIPKCLADRFTTLSHSSGSSMPASQSSPCDVIPGEHYGHRNSLVSFDKTTKPHRTKDSKASPGSPATRHQAHSASEAPSRPINGGKLQLYYDKTGVYEAWVVNNNGSEVIHILNRVGNTPVKSGKKVKGARMTDLDSGWGSWEEQEKRLYNRHSS